MKRSSELKFELDREKTVQSLIFFFDDDFRICGATMVCEEDLKRQGEKRLPKELTIREGIARNCLRARERRKGTGFSGCKRHSSAFIHSDF